MKKRRKKHIVFMPALTGVLMLSAYGRTGAADSFTENNFSTYMETSVTEESLGSTLSASGRMAYRAEKLADIIGGIQECNPDIEKCAREKYKEYTLVFGLDDFAPREIDCDNVFSVCQDGRENPEIQALYDAAGEQWEYLWYVECDYDGDGELDYIVLHDCPDKKEGVNIGGGDIWKAKDFQRRRKLPETTYLIGGTWQEPQLYMMLFDGLRMEGVAVYQDYARQDIALYGWNGGYGRVRARTIEEEISGVRIRQTSFSIPYSDGYDPVRLEIMWDGEDGPGYQVIMTDRVRSPLSPDRPNCMAWDGNDDGCEDILYYTGNDGGSGGSWDFYDLLCWSEEEQKYVVMELPQCNRIDYENHKLYSSGQIGAPHQYYKIYGLRGGEYQIEKRLDLVDSPGGDKLTARYSEYEEFVEETEFSLDMDWEEICSILEEKYPEFTFWRVG
ncbi:MAG: hypothetical protein K2O34_05150 [Acetatifactor sp.]|nr:hypothetical protein [Acetatifactor sp.]